METSHKPLRTGVMHMVQQHKVSDELLAEAERTKSTIHWLPDDADSKNWNLQRQYLSACIAFRIPKVAEQYCKRMALALKGRRRRNSRRTSLRPARHVKQHLLQKLYLLQNQYLPQNLDHN